MGSYSFKFQYVKVAWYVIGGFIAAPLLAMATFWIDESSFLLMLLAIFIPIVAGVWIAIKKGRAADSISLDSEGFQSAFYGKVLYKDIDTVSGPSIWVQTPIALKLKLHTGKKLIWALSDKSNIYNTKEDAATFNRFTEDLSIKMDAYYGANPLEIPVANSNNSGKNTGVGGHQPGPVHQRTKNNPGASLKKGITVGKAAKTAIPLGSIILLMLAFKNCGTHYIRDKKDREVREIFQSVESRYGDAVNHAKHTLDSIQKAYGPVFVYTNDSNITVQLMPDINTDDAQRLSSVPVLAHGAMTDSLEKFAHYPDSFAYNILLKTQGDQMLTITKSVLNYRDSATTWLYLACYDPSLKVATNGKLSVDSLSADTRPFSFATGIPIYQNQSLLESMQGATMNLKMLLARTKFSHHYKIYLLSVSKKDHVSESLFQEVITIFNQQLQQVKGDTTAFHFSIR